MPGSNGKAPLARWRRCPGLLTKCRRRSLLWQSERSNRIAESATDGCGLLQHIIAQCQRQERLPQAVLLGESFELRSGGALLHCTALPSSK